MFPPWKNSVLIPAGLILYHCPVENTHILRGFRECNQRKWPFLQAFTQSEVPQWANYAHKRVFVAASREPFGVRDLHPPTHDAIM
jgi:hypothetical protein